VEVGEIFANLGVLQAETSLLVKARKVTQLVELIFVTPTTSRVE